MANYVKLLPTIGAEIPHLDFTFMIGDTHENSIKLRAEDQGKAVKFADGLPDSRVVFCEDGDEINGQIITVEPNQTSAGFRFGTIRVIGSFMFDAINSGAEALGIGDEVVAADQADYGLPNNPMPYHMRMRVRKAEPVETPAEGEPMPAVVQRLRVVSIQDGTGATGSIVTLSRVMH